MATLIFDRDADVAAWAGSRMPHVGADGFGPCTAIGIAETAEANPFWAAVVFHHYVPAYGVCEVSIAAEDGRWAQRGTIRALLHYPFEQLSCRKVQGTIPASNTRAIDLIEGLGFRREATLRHYFAKGEHAHIFGMMAHEYRAKWSN